MRYTVVWLPSAEDELARLWIQAADRQEMSDASNRIERALQRDPDLKGWLQEGYRYYTDPPLLVAYEVSPDDRLVTIAGVWQV